MGTGSFDVGFNRLQLAALAKDLKATQPAMRKALPGGLRKAFKPVVDAAKANAAAVSPNIKVGVRTRLASRNGASIKVIGTSPDKPILAGLLERGKSGADTPTPWTHQGYTQDPQPYLQPAIDEHGDEAIAACSEIITEVLRATRFL